jgi:hypothetical protein
MTVKKQCPKCKEAQLSERVKRSLWVKILLFWLPIKRYKCNKCGKKSYILDSSKSAGPKVEAA